MTFEDIDILVLIIGSLKLPYHKLDDRIMVNKKCYLFEDYKTVGQLIKLIKQDNDL